MSYATRTIPGKARIVPSLVVAACVASRTAHAGAGDAAAAEVLFKQARELALASKYAEACPKFEESQKLDPGMGTLYNLADCYAHVGRHASSWAAFTEVADAAKRSGQTDREDDARKRATSEEKQLSYLTIHAKAVGYTPEVKRDGVVVGPGQLGIKLPVDDGPHAIEARAQGRQPWSEVVEVHGETVVQVPALSAAVEPLASVTEKRPVAPPKESSTQRVVGITLIAGGAAAVGVGGIFGLLAMSKNDDSNTIGGCSSSTNKCTDPRGPGLRDDARTDGTLATVFMVGGVVIATAGVATLLLVPKRIETARIEISPALGPSLFGAQLGGAF